MIKMTDNNRKPDLMVLVEYTDDEGEVTGWDLWSDGCLVQDFHVDAGDTYEDAYNHASEMGFERLPDPVVDDWNDPIWRAYADSANTDAGYMQTVDVFGKDEED